MNSKIPALIGAAEFFECGLRMTSLSGVTGARDQNLQSSLVNKVLEKKMHLCDGHSVII